MHDDQWFRRRINRLPSPLSAWFALDCVSRAMPHFVKLAERDPRPLMALCVAQGFLLGHNSIGDLARARSGAEGARWPLSPGTLARYVSTAAIYTCHFGRPSDYVEAAKACRRLHSRSADADEERPETDLQAESLEYFFALCQTDPIKGLTLALDREQDLRLLPIIADAMLEVGFALPLGDPTMQSGATDVSID